MKTILVCNPSNRSQLGNQWKGGALSNPCNCQSNDYVFIICNEIPTREIPSAINANAINLKAIRQAIHQPTSSCAIRPTVISCASSINMLYLFMQSLQVKWIGPSMQMQSNMQPNACASCATVSSYASNANICNSRSVDQWQSMPMRLIYLLINRQSAEKSTKLRSVVLSMWL